MAAQLKVIASGLEVPGMDRQKALEAALAQIDRAFGKGSAMKLGSREKMEIETISTGSLGLDIALGVGGLPRGRIVEVERDHLTHADPGRVHRLEDRSIACGGGIVTADAIEELEHLIDRERRGQRPAELGRAHAGRRIHLDPAIANGVSQERAHRRQLAGDRRAFEPSARQRRDEPSDVVRVEGAGAAGVLFCELRRRSDSLLAPIGLHWATNALGYVAAFALARLA